MEKSGRAMSGEGRRIPRGSSGRAARRSSRPNFEARRRFEVSASEMWEVDKLEEVPTLFESTDLKPANQSLGIRVARGR
jgi:hypothetical protein